MRFYLIVAKGKKQGLPIPIDFDLFQIGSGEHCQLRAMHESIGDEHCVLIQRDRRVYVCDLDSGGTTCVNGNEVPPGVEWPLHAGDLLDVGPLHFLIQYHERAMSKSDLEEWALKCIDTDVTRRVTAMDRLDTLLGASSRRRDDAASTASTMLDQLSMKSGVVMGRMRISREAGITVVRLHEPNLVDEAELALVCKELHDNLNRPNLKVLFDMKQVRRLSSSAAEMFGELNTWLKPFGSRFAMCRLRDEMQELLRAFPNTRSIPCFPDKPIAISARW